MLHPWISALIGGGVLVLGSSFSYARADGAPNAQPGVEAQAHGPLHEAFAQPVDAQPQPGPLAPNEPPPLIDEIPPDQKPVGNNVQWIPGYWHWDDDQKQFLWISGFWRQVPPGGTWHPGAFTKATNGWRWTSGYWSTGAAQQTVLPDPPPAPVRSQPATPPPNNSSIVVPGVWVYRDARYRWRPAYYLDNRPGWVWQPAQYIRTPNGYVFVDGYWDYPLAKRGLLFAPVAIDPSLLNQSNWTYTPSYVVNSAFLPTALFVRTGWNHYYFGDYFGAGYARRGFTPWFDYRFGGGYYDPLFAYYRRTADPSLLPVYHRYAQPLTPLALVDRQAINLRTLSAVERQALNRQLARTPDPVRVRGSVAAPPRPRHTVGSPRIIRKEKVRAVKPSSVRKTTKASASRGWAAGKRKR